MCSTDQLICEYYDCTDEAHCIHGYEVCDENPLYGDSDFLVCVAVLYQPSNMLESLFKGCFFNEYDYCDTCVLKEKLQYVYSCCCNSTLCNSNNNLIMPSNHTTVMQPTGYYITKLYIYDSLYPSA